MQSCNAKGRRQRKQPKTSVGLISKKKKTLHVQHTFFFSKKQKPTLHAFFVHFFAVVFHDYNVKLPSYTFYGGSVVCVPVHFFPLPLISTLVAASNPFFAPPLQNFCFSSNEIGFLWFLSLALQS